MKRPAMMVAAIAAFILTACETAPAPSVDAAPSATAVAASPSPSLDAADAEAVAIFKAWFAAVSRNDIEMAMALMDDEIRTIDGLTGDSDFVRDRYANAPCVMEVDEATALKDGYAITVSFSETEDDRGPCPLVGKRQYYTMDVDDGKIVRAP
jgi:hypothetical protein